MNNKANVANLLIGDLCKESWVKGAVQRASALSAYVRGYQRLLAAYKQAKNQDNAILSVEVAAEKRTAVAYLTPSTRIFANHRDLLSACVRTRPAQRNILERANGTEDQRLGRPRDQTARNAQATFILVAESTADARDWEVACSILDPVQVNSLSLVLPATRQLQETMAGLEAKLRFSGLAA